MIHKDPSQTSYEQSVCNEKKNGSIPTTKPTIPARFLINLENEKMNEINMDVTVSSGGSMTQMGFFNYAEHFVKNLPEGQGKDGESVILFLDGHLSR